MIHLVDVHCHLQADMLAETLDETVTDAAQAGIHCITNATSPDDWNSVIDISCRFPGVSAALGIHPWYIPSNYKNHLKHLADYRGRILALGETGLDKRRSHIPLEIQTDSLYTHMSLAYELQLPLICHCISAHEELIALLKKFPKGAITSVIHAFTGSRELAQSLSRFGCCFSIAGNAVYATTQKRKEMLSYIYTNNLMLLESDSPDLPPPDAPSGPNKPLAILSTLNLLGSLMELSPSLITEKTTSLARSLFCLL